LLPKQTDPIVLDKPCKVFQYRVQIQGLDAKYEAMKNRNVGNEGISFHDTFKPISGARIQPGCQVLVTGKIKI
jgi:hypothetical protein